MNIEKEWGSKVIKVAVLYSGNVYASNGASSYIKHIIEMRSDFAKKGIDIRAFCGPAKFTSARSYRKSLKYTLKYIAKRILSLTNNGTSILIEKAYFTPAKYAVDQFNASRFDPDIVIFNDAFVQYCYCNNNDNRDRVLINVMHNNGQIGLMLRERYPKISEGLMCRLERNIFESSDCIAFVGESNRRRFLDLNPGYAGRTVSLRSGIDGMGVSKQSKGTVPPITFVTVGTVNTRKNQRGLIRAFLECPSSPKLKLIIVGDGEDMSFCKRLASNCRTNREIEFVGVSDDVSAFYSMSDVYISASHDEGLPIAAIEAMSCRLPIILSDVGSCRELIRDNGILLKSTDHECVAKAIDEMVRRSDDFDRMGEASYRLFSSQYSSNCMLEDYLNLILTEYKYLNQSKDYS